MSINEEQIAIETLKEVASDDFDTLGDEISPKMAQNILNVISKQQKEIEELNKLHYDLGKNFIDLDSKCKQQQKEINKAIEYIENAKKELYGCGNYYLSDLFNILKGELNGTKRGRKESDRVVRKSRIF